MYNAFRLRRLSAWVSIATTGSCRNQFAQRSSIISPWRPARGLAMIAGYRGIGKTFVAASVAYAIATGGALLGFLAPKPRKVLYFDGEMDLAELQGRFEAIHAA